MSTQQERKVFAEWYWGGKTESERSYFYRSGSLRPGRTRDIWSAWQKGASVAKAEADASLASKDAEIAQMYAAAGEAQAERDAARDERDALAAEVARLRLECASMRDELDSIYREQAARKKG